MSNKNPVVTIAFDGKNAIKNAEDFSKRIGGVVSSLNSLVSKIEAISSKIDKVFSKINTASSKVKSLGSAVQKVQIVSTLDQRAGLAIRNNPFVDPFEQQAFFSREHSRDAKIEARLVKQEQAELRRLWNSAMKDHVEWLKGVTAQAKVAKIEASKAAKAIAAAGGGSFVVPRVGPVSSTREMLPVGGPRGARAEEAAHISLYREQTKNAKAEEDAIRMLANAVESRNKQEARLEQIWMNARNRQQRLEEAGLRRVTNQFESAGRRYDNKLISNRVGFRERQETAQTMATFLGERGMGGAFANSTAGQTKQYARMVARGVATPDDVRNLAKAEGHVNEILRKQKLISQEGATASNNWQKFTTVLKHSVGLYAMWGGWNMFRGAVKSGFEFLSTVEKARLGIAEVTSVSNEFVDSSGRVLDAWFQIHFGMKAADRAMKQIMEDSMKYGLQVQDFIQSYTVASGLSQKSGISQERAIGIMRNITILAQRANIPFTQLARSIDNVFSGIRVGQTQVGVILGISQKLIESEKAKGGESFSRFLEDRLSAVNAALEKNMDTFEGLKQAFYSRMDVFASKVLFQGFEEVKDTLRDALGYLDRIFTDQKKLDELTATVVGMVRAFRELFNLLITTVSKIYEHRQLLLGLGLIAGGYKVGGVYGAAMGGVTSLAGSGGVQKTASFLNADSPTGGNVLTSMAGYGTAGWLLTKIAKDIFSGGGPIIRMQKGLQSLKLTFQSLQAWLVGGLSALLRGLVAATAMVMANPYVAAAVAIGAVAGGAYYLAGGNHRAAAAKNAESARMSPIIREDREIMGNINYFKKYGMQEITETNALLGDDTEVGRKLGEYRRQRYIDLVNDTEHRISRGLRSDDPEVKARAEKQQSAYDLIKGILRPKGGAEMDAALAETANKNWLEQLKKEIAVNEKKIKAIEDSYQLLEAENKLAIGKLEIERNTNELKSKLNSALSDLFKAQSDLDFNRQYGARKTGLEGAIGKAGVQLDALGYQREYANEYGTVGESRSLRDKIFAKEDQIQNMHLEVAEIAIKAAEREEVIATKAVELAKQKTEEARRQLDLEEKILAIQERTESAKLNGLRDAKLIAQDSIDKIQAYVNATEKGLARNLDGSIDMDLSDNELVTPSQTDQLGRYTTATGMLLSAKGSFSGLQIAELQAQATLEGIEASQGNMGLKRRIARVEGETEEARALNEQQNAINGVTKSVDDLETKRMEGVLAAEKRLKLIRDETEANLGLSDSYSELFANLLFSKDISKDFKEGMKQISQNAIKTMFSNTLKEKIKFDSHMKKNFLEYLPGIGEEGGKDMGTGFIGNLMGSVKGGLGKVFGTAGKTTIDEMGVRTSTPGTAGMFGGNTMGIMGGLVAGLSMGETSKGGGSLGGGLKGIGSAMAMGAAAGSAGGGLGMLIGATAGLVGKGIVDTIAGLKNYKNQNNIINSMRGGGLSLGGLPAMGGALLATGLTQTFGLGESTSRGLTAGLTLGTSELGNVLGSTGSMALGAALLATPLAPLGIMMMLGGIIPKQKPKTPGTIMKKYLKPFFNQINFPRVFKGASGGMMPRDVGALSGYGDTSTLMGQGQAAANMMWMLAPSEIKSAYKESTDVWGGSTSPETRAMWTLLNAGASMNLAPEDINKMILSKAGLSAGKDFQGGFLQMAGNLAKGAGTASSGKGKYTGINKEQFLGGITSLIVAFKELPTSIDATRLALESFTSSGQVSMEQLNRRIEDTKDFFSAGVSGGIEAALKTGDLVGAGAKMGDSLVNGLMKRITERLLSASAFGAIFTDVSALVSAAADAFASGDRTKGQALLSQASGKFYTGSQKFNSVMGEMYPTISAWSAVMGSGAGGFVNDMGYGLPSNATGSFTKVPGPLGQASLQIMHGGEGVRSPGEEDRLLTAIQMLAREYRRGQRGGGTNVNLSVNLDGKQIANSIKKYDNSTDGSGGIVMKPNMGVGVA